MIARWLAGPDSGPTAWMNAALFASAWHAVYGLPLDGVVRPEDLALTDALQTSCPGDVSAPESPLLLVDVGTVPGWREKLDENSPGASPAKPPLLVMQGTDDEQVPLQSTNSEVAHLCSSGDSVDYRVISGADHSAALFAQPQLDAAAWMADRLAGGAADSSRP